MGVGVFSRVILQDLTRLLELGRRGDRLAPVWIHTVGRIELSRTLGDSPQLASGLLERVDACVELKEMMIEESYDVFTG